MNQRGFVNIILVMIIVVLVGAGAYVIATRQITTPTPTPTPSPVPTPIPNPSPTPIKGTISPTGFYPIIIGKHYAMKLTAHGFGNDRPLDWNVVSGGLPPGLHIEGDGSCDGVYGAGKGGGIITYVDILICGTPEKSGTYRFTLRATIRGGQRTARCCRASIYYFRYSAITSTYERISCLDKKVNHGSRKLSGTRPTRLVNTIRV